MNIQTTKLHDKKFTFTNSEEFHIIKNEIWNERIYDLELKELEAEKVKLILDIGAHIGLSSHYFSENYPNASIVALEPNPEIFPILQENCIANNLPVECLQVAVSSENGKRKFFIDESGQDAFSTAGFTEGAWNGLQKSRQISVETVSLRKFLNSPVDILKMDIEGAEYDVLSSAKNVLGNVKYLLVELHLNGSYKLQNLVNLLTGADFEIEVWQYGKIINPVRFGKLKGLGVLKGEKKC